jgi:hypothetical protein
LIVFPSSSTARYGFVAKVLDRADFCIKNGG